jgi:hypothetical protein
MRIFLGVATVSAIEIPIDMWSEWRVAWNRSELKKWVPIHWPPPRNSYFAGSPKPSWCLGKEEGMIGEKYLNIWDYRCPLIYLSIQNSCV